MITIKLTVEEEMELRVTLRLRIDEYERVISTCSDPHHREDYTVALNHLQKIYGMILEEVQKC